MLKSDENVEILCKQGNVEEREWKIARFIGEKDESEKISGSRVKKSEKL